MDLQARIEIKKLEKRIADMEALLDMMKGLIMVNNKALQSLLDEVRTEKAA